MQRGEMRDSRAARAGLFLVFSKHWRYTPPLLGTATESDGDRCGL
jgi:hypothetical protein